MEVALYLLIPAFLLGSLIIWAFFWSVKNKQYDDLDGPSGRLLHMEERSTLPEQQDAGK